MLLRFQKAVVRGNYDTGNQAFSMRLRFLTRGPFKRAAQIDGVQEETAEPETRYAFRFRAYWFVLAQTEGEDTPVPPILGFDIDTALCSLNITRTPFDELNGNIQGFAHDREIAVNPLAGLAHKTTFHEIAHLCCIRSYAALSLEALWFS
jgi:hypothetical protein